MTPRPYASKAGQTLLDRASSRIAPRLWLSSRYDPILLDGPRRRTLAVNRTARRRFRNVEPRRLTQVGLFAFARGGSHLMESQLHFLEPCFCFGEGIRDFRDVTWRTFLLRGAFGFDSMQEKSGERLTHLVYNANSRSAWRLPTWDPEAHCDLSRYWVFVSRNPFRVLASMANTGKDKWALTADNAADFLHYFRSLTAHFRRLRDTVPDRTVVLSVERFFLRRDMHFVGLCERLGLPRQAVAEAPDPHAFFGRVFRCGSRPVLRDGYLASPKTGARICGRGGGFNPIADVDVARLFSEVRDLPDDVIGLAREILGDEAVAFYLDDPPHRYETLDDDRLLDLIDRRARVA